MTLPGHWKRRSAQCAEGHEAQHLKVHVAKLPDGNFGLLHDQRGPGAAAIPSSRWQPSTAPKGAPRMEGGINGGKFLNGETQKAERLVRHIGRQGGGTCSSFDRIPEEAPGEEERRRGWRMAKDLTPNLRFPTLVLALAIFSESIQYTEFFPPSLYSPSSPSSRSLPLLGLIEQRAEWFSHPCPRNQLRPAVIVFAMTPLDVAVAEGDVFPGGAVVVAAHRDNRCWAGRCRRDHPRRR